MYRSLLYYFFICCAGFFCSNLWAQQPLKKNKEVVPFLLKPYLTYDQRFNPDDLQIIVNRPYAVQGSLPPGIEVTRKLSDSIGIVIFHSQEEIKKWQEKVRVLGEVNDDWKLSPALFSEFSKGMREEKIMGLLLSVQDIRSFEKQYERGKQVMIKAAYPTTGTLQITAPLSWVKTMALKDPNILFIARTGLARTERELTGFDLSANKVNIAHRNWPGVNGSGLTVSIKENRMDTSDIDFRGRYLFSPSASSNMQTHATNMATIAAGGGNSYYTGKGVAWGASISSSDFMNLLPDNILALEQLKVTVQNHSYGVGIENYYGADAAAYDAQLAQNPALVHVFSAGNSGNMASISGNYAGITGYANLTGSFKMAKNILTVGATDSFGIVAGLSSRGPAYDGRVKPELVALGEDGSSGAAAIVSGISLLIQDAWQQKNGSLPSSALVKSILLNSAEDVGSAGIDFLSGYGRVNALGALETVAQNHLLQGVVKQGQTTIHTISIPQNAIHLKLTVCWTDPPSQANSFQSLVNDLDLSLFHPLTAQRWLPWVLNSNPHIDSLKQLPVRKRDSLNNTEQITLDIPPAGNYQIEVKGFSITGQEQAYAIAWQYDTLEHFIFTYPVKGDNMFPLQTHTLRWETTVPGSATLQYRINSGSWLNGASGIDLLKGYYQWEAPDKQGTMELRMIAGIKEWHSDTVSLSNKLLINTGFNCVDSFLIYWQRAAVDSYRVYRLGARYMEPFLLSADSSVVQAKKNNPFQYFTVAPVLPVHMEGIRAYTFNYTQQNVDCYISGFIADPSPPDKAKLFLQLGTTYQLSKVVFEKLTASGYVPIRTITPVTVKQFTVTEAAAKGLNTYRARIELQSGQVYYTKPEQVFLFAGQSYYVFPNPIRQGASLRLLSEETDDTLFLLYDLYGRKIAEYTINGFLNEIRLPLLQKGIYYYAISKGGIRQVSEKLVVL